MDNKKEGISKITLISWIIIAVYLIAGCFYIKSLPSSVYGDGYEYMFQTTSFRNHLSFEVTEQDVDDTAKVFDDSRAYDKYDDLTLDKDGKAYCNHFGFYSVLVLPLRMLLFRLGYDPTYSFFIFNLILMIAAASVTLLFLKTDDIKKLCLVLLMLLSPAFLYISWVHTEVYIFAFCCMGLVFWHNKRRDIAILMVSIAAIQNLGILPLGMMIGIDHIIDVSVASKNEKKKVPFLCRKILPYGFLYLPAFVPMAMNLIHFGTISVIADKVTDTTDLLRKMAAFVMDPNIGIIVYAPVMVIGFAAVAIASLITKVNLRKTVLYVLAVLGMLFIVAFERQINCGMNGIMRYCVWIFPILFFYFVLNFDFAFRNYKLFHVLSGLSAVLTAIIMSLFLWGPFVYGQNDFSPLAKLVLSTCPSVYDPPVGIFYSRCCEHELYYSEDPVSFYDSEGYSRKIIVSKEALNKLKDGSWLIVDDDLNALDINDIDMKEYLKGEIWYIDLQKGYRLYSISDKIDYYRESNDVPRGSGMYKDSETYCWLRPDAFMAVNNSDSVQRYGLELVIEPSRSVYKKSGTDFNTEIYINGTLVRTIAEDDMRYDKKNRFLISPDLIPDDDILFVELRSSQFYGSDSALDTNEESFRFMYLGPVIFYEVGEYINFAGSDRNSGDFLDTTLYVEDDNAWTSGTEFKLTIFIDTEEYAPGTILTGNLDTDKVLGDEQTVELKVNGVLNDTVVLTDDEDEFVFFFEVPEDGRVELRFNLPDATSPAA
ncbi:MAG: hypothetical protein IKT14_03525, partial [Clostridiales bacterium]|nr:hypothetical protein [Clostridiales bacterium]